jgi:sigma-E factor negative regulatory protein RseB
MFQVSPVPSLRLFGRILVTLCAAGAFGLAGATPPAGGQGARGAERSIGEWLMRMHEASRRRSYIGTFVVSSYAGALSTARIWHACEGDVQMERMESLTGVPRAIFRRNDDVVTFLPESKVVRSEKRESLGLFPNLLTGGENSIPDFYGARALGTDRVAGHDADVVHLAPKDSLRYGYRIWSERKSGLVVKLQTLDTEGNVLEQAAFSELQLDAPVRMDKLAQMMASTEGYRVEKADVVRTTAAAEDPEERGRRLQADELLQAPGQRKHHAVDLFRRARVRVPVRRALRPAAPHAGGPVRPRRRHPDPDPPHAGLVGDGGRRGAAPDPQGFCSKP